jgi:hypothetical protein
MILKYEKARRVLWTPEAEEAFEKILQGYAVGWYTEMGYANLLKQNFENEVEVTTVTIEHSVRKLGIRK